MGKKYIPLWILCTISGSQEHTPGSRNAKEVICMQMQFNTPILQELIIFLVGNLLLLNLEKTCDTDLRSWTISS